MTDTSDASEAGLPQRSPQSEEIIFEGDVLIAVRLAGEGLAIPVRDICHALGLDVDNQGARLREHDVLSRGLRLTRVRYGDRLRSIVTILHKYIPFWLATISPAQVSAAARPKLVRYQIELVDLLAAIYGGMPVEALPAPNEGNMVVAQRLADALQEVRLAREAFLAEQQLLIGTIKNHELRLSSVESVVDSSLVTIGSQVEALQEQLATHTTITGPQQESLKRGIQHIAHAYEKRTGKSIYARLFSQFCMDLGTPRYDALPAGRYQDALEWIRKQSRVYLPEQKDPPALQEGLEL